MALPRFSDEVLEQVRQVNIIEYAIYQGYDILKKGRDYKIKDGSGLILRQDGLKWNRLSEDDTRAGGGIIQFVMYTKEIAWPAAVKDLIAYGNIQHETGEAVAVFRKTFKPKVIEKIDFEPPKKNNTVKHLYSYLIETRKIDHGIVAYYTNKNMIYEDDHRNCVFCCFDEKGEMKNASLRGSYDTKGDPFKGMPGGSDKNYPFAFQGQGNNVFVFEAPIDLMSFQTMKKRFGDLDQQKGDHYIALNGVISGPLIQYLEGHKNIDKVIFCLDNDLAGTKNTACLSNVLDEKYLGKYKIDMRVPKGKDWNEELIEKTLMAEKWKNQMELDDEWDREQ